MKYATILQDPNACMYRSCNPYEYCIRDPTGYVDENGDTYFVYRASLPLIPVSLMEDYPVYNSLLNPRAYISNLGGQAAYAPITYKLNSLPYFNDFINISAQTTILYPYNPTPTYGHPLPLGENVIEVEIDPNNLINELRKDNNNLSLVFNVTHYADYRINEVYIGNQYGERYIQVPSGFEVYIIANVSNLGNHDGYVLLNGSINGQEFYNGQVVVGTKCDYGRKPYGAYVPANSSELIFIGPIRLAQYEVPTTLTLALSIYPIITGYPEDLNLSNNDVALYTFEVVPSPPELDFYNSTIVGDYQNYTLRPTSSYFTVDWVEDGRWENITISIWNLGATPATVNLSIYQDIFEGGLAVYSIYHYFDANTLLSSLNAPIYQTEITLYPGENNVTLPLDISYDPSQYHNWIFRVDQVGDEEPISNIYILHYYPPDVGVQVYTNLYPLPGSALQIDYRVYCRDLHEQTGDGHPLRGTEREGDMLHIAYYPYAPYNVSPPFTLEIYTTFLQQNISLPTLCSQQHQIENTTYVSLPTDFDELPLDIHLVYADDLYPSNNIVNLTLKAPRLYDFEIDLKNEELLASTFNTLEINFQAPECINLDHLSIYLTFNNTTTLLLYSGGRLATFPGKPGWKTICENTSLSLEVYVPNISTDQAQITVQALSGYKAILPADFHFTMPYYDKLWYEAETLPLKINNATYLIVEPYPHVGNFSPNSTIVPSQPLILYLYKEVIYNKNVTILHHAPLEVKIS